MKDSQAIRPGSFFEALPSVVKDIEARKKGLTPEEQEYFVLSQTAGWKQFLKDADLLMRDLDQGTATAMAQGLPFEEIGRNAVVIDLAKGIIKRLIEKVEDAREVVDGE